MKKPFAIILILVFLAFTLTGCVTVKDRTYTKTVEKTKLGDNTSTKTEEKIVTPKSTPHNPEDTATPDFNTSNKTEEKTGMKDRTRTTVEGAIVGAIVVGGLAVIITALTGDTRAIKAAAVYGTAIGAAIGASVGMHVADQKEKYASEEDWLNACITNIETVIAGTSLYNQQMVKEIESLELQCNLLYALYDKKKVEKSVLKRERRKIETKQGDINDKLSQAMAELEVQEKVLAEAKAEERIAYAARLEKRIEELDRYIKELETQTDVLASMSQRMSV